MDSLKILCVSNLQLGYPMRQRYEAMLDIGFSVKGIDYAIDQEHSSLLKYLGRLSYWLFRQNVGNFPMLDVSNVNGQILDAMKETRWNILWLDRALVVDKHTLIRVKQLQPDCKIVGFSHDDMAQRHNQSKQFIEHLPFYDVFYTTKSYNVKELEGLGCKQCEFIDNSFDPEIHRPFFHMHFNNNAHRYSVGFIGHWEKEREDLFNELAETGINISVWGGGWDKCSLRHSNLEINREDIVGDEYAKTLCSMDIALCMLRKINRDLQTTRSIEIPACGVFMLGERTDEHLALFEEGKEAEFFSTTDELTKKIEYYLNNPEKREAIAAAGRERCLRSGYANQDRIKRIFEGLYSRSVLE